MLGVALMARARPNPLAAARLVLVPLLALVGVLVGLLFSPSALAAAGSVAPGAFAAGAPEAALSLALVAVRGPAFRSAAMPATIASSPLGRWNESGRHCDDGRSRQDESVTFRGLGPRPQLTRFQPRSFGDLPADLPRAAAWPPSPRSSAAFAAGRRLRALELREHLRVESIDRDLHGPRGPPSQRSV